jgi:hypothetical protein
MQINKFIAVPLAVATLALSGWGMANAQVVGPRVALQFGTNGLTSPLNANADDAVIARLLLDTTGSTEAVRISSLPFNLITGGGALAGSLENCRVYNEADVNTALNTATGDLVSGINNIALNNTLTLGANTMTTLSLRCDVGSDLVSGGTYTINMNTANVVATGASTGLPAAVTVRGAVVVPPVVVIPPVITPGLPTTGAANEMAQNLAMIIAALLMAGLGVSYMNVKRQS